MSRPILEVIALDAQDARAAEAGGADRLELVTDMAADGLTPSLETFAEIRAAVSIPLRVMLRTAAGFGTGGAPGLDALCERAGRLRAAGADEFVLGFLDTVGQPDLSAVHALTDRLAGCSWTFHRAIDRAVDRPELRRRLAEHAGLDTYLTAGSPFGVDEGLPVLRDEAARGAKAEPGYEPRLMAGGGLRLDHVPELLAVGVSAFHIGGAARESGWSTPVRSAAVRTWRAALDA
ncbi:copper homeostasis protein CutC [Streptomyces oceani]|uniref:Copper homeostasis protein cutC homolog n=1 Tax=Streptomyces oceani TaxID=1075402 RepID=A0A1E7KM65_9ACTN|nr:copper homeostasis protein CutC [Streptomyces oceani]OEV04998.1 copper homeostasis protein CutC [Streptomyces oceani]